MQNAFGVANDNVLKLADDWIVVSIINNKIYKALEGTKEAAQLIQFLVVYVSDNKR